MISIIQPDAANYDSFSVNLAVNSTQIFSAAGGDSSLRPVPFGFPPLVSFFAPKDSFTILSIGYWLPYGFIAGDWSPKWFKIQVEYLASGAWLTLPNWSADFSMPMLGVEMNLGQFCDMHNQNGKFRLRCQWNSNVNNPGPWISMLGVPAALGGTTQNSYFWAKVEHTLPFVV